MAFATKQWTDNEIKGLLRQTRERHQIPESLTKIYDALLYALNSSRSYYNPDGTAIHMNKASTRMDFLTGAMLEVMNNNVLPLKYRKECRFCWVEHMGKVRLSLVYQPRGTQSPQIISGEFFKKIDGFDLNLYQKMIAMFKNSAKFLYLGGKIEETGPGENHALVLKTTRIDSIMPYVKERVARDYAFKYVNDRVSYVAKTNRQLTNLFRFLLYVPLALIPVVGWALIYILEVFNTPNFIAKEFGPDQRQEDASQKLTTSYYNLTAQDKIAYNKVVRSFGDLSSSPISETDMDAYCQRVSLGRGRAMSATGSSSTKKTPERRLITDQTKRRPLQIVDARRNAPKQSAAPSGPESAALSKTEKRTSATSQKSQEYPAVSSKTSQTNEPKPPRETGTASPNKNATPSRSASVQRRSNAALPKSIADSDSITNITNRPNPQNRSRKSQTG